MLLSFHVQLPSYTIHERKLHFIACKALNLFSFGSFEHLNKVDVWATVNSKLEEQRSVITRNPRKASSHLLAQKSQEPQSECGY